jgi:MYXO-CTERM domain-containing protein
LTALFRGTENVTGGGTLTFTGNVDGDVIIYYRTSGTSGPYTLLAVTPMHLSNQRGFDFTLASLGTGLYDFEIFYADRSSTQAVFTLNAVVTAAVPGPSTWAMLILGFAGLGALSYRRRHRPSFKVA